ncbi:MAG TPA: MFS transporter [Myxococcota bacterium]|nr:MFS transporter [Myxococcota bacterium]
MVRPTRKPLRHDLRAMSFDAAAFSVMVGVGETYVPAFALAVGAGQATAGLLASVPPVAGAVLQLASPAAVHRLGSHRRWVVLCASMQAAAFLPLLAAALVGHIPTAFLFLITSLYWGSGMATGPAWNTWVGTIVPARMRTRYFAWRTRVAQAAVLLGLLAGGATLQIGQERAQPLHAFALLFLVAAICRTVSAALLASQSEPVPLPEDYRHVEAREALTRLFGHGREARLLLYLLSVQIAVQLSAPYFTPYMLKQLNLPYGSYMTLLAASFGAKILMMPVLAWVSHRFGAHRLLVVGGLGIVPLSLLWLVSDNLGYLLGVQCLAGTFWGAYELATFLLVFETIREDERTSVLTSFNFANAVAMVGGSLVGGFLLKQLGEVHHAYMVIFATSTAARALSVGFLLRIPAEVARPTPLAVRTVAVRPSAGSLDRPIVASLPQEGDEAHIEEREAG